MNFAWLFCLIFVLQIFVYIFSIYLCIFVCANIFGAIVLKPRFKIDVVVVVIWSIVIIINSVLTLQVSTASLPHDREPCKMRLCSTTLDSLHTCVCAGLHRVRVRLSGLINGRNQFNSWGFPQVPHSGPGLCPTTGKHVTSHNTFEIRVSMAKECLKLRWIWLKVVSFSRSFIKGRGAEIFKQIPSPPSWDKSAL
jgi:hypothetical protein